MAVAVLIYYYFFSAMASSGTPYIYIDTDDNIDSVDTKLSSECTPQAMAAFRFLGKFTSYGEHIRTGRYKIDSGSLMMFRKLKNGLQCPVSLTIPSVRTVGDLAAAVSQKMMIGSAELSKALSDSAVCARYGFTVATMPCLFVPNTYDIYWNVTVDKFLDRMHKEYKKFWNYERTQKAKALQLTPAEVVTLASIVDEETANDVEKPMVAGMYYNRLVTGMPLQADPTVRFALNDFSIKRIYNNMLSVKSPYNTYRNTGLPPGPIRIPSVAGIDAVLNRVHHKYLYMCAKEDFSGTHNFAETYEEHLENAERYSKALNQRGIK